MVTLYRLQRRNLMYASTPTVPNNFQLIAELAPAAGFVGTKEPSLTSHAGAEGEILINIYSGRSGVVSHPPLPPVAVTLLLAPHHITLMGNKVVVSGKLTSLSEIPDVVGTIEHAILPLLNLEIHDTATIINIHGNVGGEPIQWGFNTAASGTINSVEIGTYTNVLFDAIYSITKYHGNDRLYGALHYFSNACRLARVGNSLWEFAPEIVLNFAKICECLFEGESEKINPGSMDHCRAGLIKLGLTADEIETSYIPVLILRNDFDSGHVSLGLYDTELMIPIYSYLELS